MGLHAGQANRQIPVRKFRRILDYLSRIELDADLALSEIGYNHRQLQDLQADDLLPVMDYSRLYGVAVKHMQSLRRPIPWAAGIGSDAFELMAYSIISCKTLGDALQRADRFDHLLYPLLGYRMSLSMREDTFELHYHVRTKSSEEVFAPQFWDWAEHFETVAHLSGLMVWFKFSSWLIGRSIELNSLQVAAPFVSETYEQGVKGVFNCPIHFDAKASCFSGSLESLSLRLVHSPESLARFLENSIYELIAVDDRSHSTTAAIRSLINRDFNNGIPSFKEMAGYLHCSESSLRRRLQQENINYQEIKDQLRCEMAIEHLRNRDTSINELAEILGFAEPSSFVRSFRSWVGTTPSAYRKNVLAR